MSPEGASLQDGAVQRRIQPLWKDLISTALVLGAVWWLAGYHHFRGGWFIFACVISGLTIPALVFRQLGIVPLKHPGD
jgi:hypothetical protein